MKIEGDYGQDGYALVRQIVPAEVAGAFLAEMRSAIGVPSVDLSQWPTLPVLDRPALDVYSKQAPFMGTFLWGLTPVMSEIADKQLLPTYCYFRVYQKGDRCLVHADRPACEHSLSLTLGTSDGKDWPLDVGEKAGDYSASEPAESFGDQRSSALVMGQGDGVVYRGVEHLHGRTQPNPNRWSAHLFLHWIDKDGPHAAEAFDGAGEMPAVNFSFTE